MIVSDGVNVYSILHAVHMSLWLKTELFTCNCVPNGRTSAAAIVSVLKGNDQMMFFLLMSNYPTVIRSLLFI